MAIMNFDDFIRLSEQYDVRIDTHDNFSRNVPAYYDSLRHAFIHYFSTFITQNSSYNFYAEGLSRGNLEIFSRQILDESNTVLALVNFQRFFELYLKDKLASIDEKLILSSRSRLNNGTSELFQKIKDGSFVPKIIHGRVITVAFREAINRFYDLADMSKQVHPGHDAILDGIADVLQKHPFLDSAEVKAVFQYLNWNRDRILHNGNRLPSMWLLDFSITQKVLPIVSDLLGIEQPKMGVDFYYLKTSKGIDILQGMSRIKFEFDDLLDPDKVEEVYGALMVIGHFKELGRANMNMNLYVRDNMATYEYNYKDPIGRGRRFAEAEKDYKDFDTILDCPCCGNHSLVRYAITIPDDFMNPGHPLLIEWVKCYTCDYHLRVNAHDPYWLKLSASPIFTERKD